MGKAFKNISNGRIIFPYVSARPLMIILFHNFRRMKNVKVWRIAVLERFLLLSYSFIHSFIHLFIYLFYFIVIFCYLFFHHNLHLVSGNSALKDSVLTTIFQSCRKKKNILNTLDSWEEKKKPTTRYQVLNNCKEHLLRRKIVFWFQYTKKNTQYHPWYDLPVYNTYSEVMSQKGLFIIIIIFLNYFSIGLNSYVGGIFKAAIKRPLKKKSS